MARRTVEVVYAHPEGAALAQVEVEPGMTVRGAIERSGLLRQFPEIDLSRQRVGVFGRLGTLEDAVAPGERIEIYRPLLIDPKELRRRRARR